MVVVNVWMFAVLECNCIEFLTTINIDIASCEWIETTCICNAIRLTISIKVLNELQVKIRMVLSKCLGKGQHFPRGKLQAITASKSRGLLLWQTGNRHGGAKLTTEQKKCSLTFMKYQSCTKETLM